VIGEDIIVKVHRTKNVPIPEYQTPGSAGCDVVWPGPGSVIIRPGERVLLDSGLKLEFSSGHECQIRSRSGLANSHGLIVLNAPATIDSDFRGELKVLMYNSGTKPITINRGDRFAQLVFAPVTRATFVEVAEGDQTVTQRGSGGLGSTGV
jgi:dUTP pyrophosphatase